MSRKNRNKSRETQQFRSKPTYKGPYQENPNLLFQNVKKSMRPEVEGPTVDTFSNLDSTTSILPNEDNDIRTSKENVKRPTKEKKFPFSVEAIVLFFLGLAATGIGIIVYTHSNKFVAVEKDINYIQVDLKDQKEVIKTIENNTISLDKKIDLLDQKVDLKSNKNR